METGRYNMSMQGKFQHQAAFYLTGRLAGSALQPFDASHRSALFARCTDLTSLRYDFPLVLNRDGAPEQSVLSLSRLVDEAVSVWAGHPERDRIARHGYKLECELRKDLANGPGEFAEMWTAAAERLSEVDETLAESAKALWSAFQASGDLVEVDIDLPFRLVRHAWKAQQASKARAFKKRTVRILQKLHDILEAEAAGSGAGRQPASLRASVGASFAGTFDFGAMSTMLAESRPGSHLSDGRRSRIEDLIGVLEQQRFYAVGPDERAAV